MKYSVVIHVENKNLLKFIKFWLSILEFSLLLILDQDPNPGSIKQRLELQFFIVIHF